MLSIDVIVPAEGMRLWQQIVIERLRAAGHDVAVVARPGSPRWPRLIVAALDLERRLLRCDADLAAIVPLPQPAAVARCPRLRLDLAGSAGTSDMPTLRLAFDGNFSDAALVSRLSTGQLPEIAAILDEGRVVRRALPMIDRRESVALGVNDALARAVTLALSAVAALEREEIDGLEQAPPSGSRPPRAAPLAASYLGRALPRLAREAWRRTRYRYAHWRVGYRFIDGPGVAETGALGGGWSVLPDPGDHFYADPFPFEWRGGSFIFVEDYAHQTRKAVISVVGFDAEGRPGAAEPVLEEDCHLSYPQVFECGGEAWMLPEASASGRLTLYRAERFPDRWTPEAVLIDGRQVSDATVLRHGGLWWLFATERDGYGSTSDAMAVFHAPKLTGLWTPHARNPILIDRRAARPGGAFVEVAGKLMLPVQDGTLGYGGGLGLCELLELDRDRIRLAPPRPVSGSGDWPYPKVHTLNRVGRLEAIDGIAAQRKRPPSRAAGFRRPRT